MKASLDLLPRPSMRTEGQFGHLYCFSSSTENRSSTFILLSQPGNEKNAVTQLLPDGALLEETASATGPPRRMGDLPQKGVSLTSWRSNIESTPISYRHHCKSIVIFSFCKDIPSPPMVADTDPLAADKVKKGALISFPGKIKFYN